VINEEAKEFLSKIGDDVGVIAVAGKY